MSPPCSYLFAYFSREGALCRAVLAARVGFRSDRSGDSPSATTCERKSTLVALALAACRRLEARMEGQLRMSLLAAVQLPTVWPGIDGAANRRREHGDTR